MMVVVVVMMMILGVLKSSLYLNESEVNHKK
jgi:hypothetical protein